MAVKLGAQSFTQPIFIVCLLCTSAENKGNPNPAPRRKGIKKRELSKMCGAVVVCATAGIRTEGWATCEAGVDF